MKKNITIAAISAAAVLIAGCITGFVILNPAEGAGSPTSEPTTIEIPETAVPVEGDLDGDGELSVWEGEQLAKGFYTLPDGTQVAIPKDQPLPQVVIDAVKAHVDPLAEYISAGDSFTLPDREGAYLEAVKEESKKTNRTIIAIMYSFGNYGGRAWVTSSPIAAQYGSKEEAIAAAQDWIGDRTDSYAYIIFE